MAIIELPDLGSWISQIEIRFSILVRKLPRRGNFTSKEHLQQRIESFITCFNTAMLFLNSRPRGTFVPRVSTLATM